MTTTPHRITWRTATSVVIANMVGTGVFTSLGYQAATIPSLPALLLLWLVGGGIALCGALTYAEIGVTLPRSGGEYNYLGKLYHPLVGFLAGWVSGTVAFAAPLALAAIALEDYVGTAVPGLPPHLLALLTIVGVTVAHLGGVRREARFQDASTLVKLVPIVVFVAAGAFATGRLLPAGLGDHDLWRQVASPAFAVSLVYVSYAYSGWNASTYIAAEIDNPRRALPLSVILGTLVVIVLYVALNAMFLAAVPIPELSGQVEVGSIAAGRLFGPTGQRIVTAAIGLGLLSTASSMVLAGSRVLHAVGEDYRALAWFARLSASGSPRFAILFQSALAVLMLLTSTFDQVLTYLGFTLTLCTTLTVAGVFVVRRRGLGGGYRTWGYPVTPVLFLAFNAWMIWYLLRERPVPSLAGFATVLAGAGVHLLLARHNRAVAAGSPGGPEAQGDPT